MSTPIDWNAIITALTGAAVAYNIWSQKRALEKAKKEKVESDAVENQYKLALRSRLISVISTVEAIRGEGNSALDIVLRTVAKTQRRLYEQTKDPADLKMAEIAEARATVAEALHAEIDTRMASAKKEQLEIEAQIKKLNGVAPLNL